VVFTLVVFVVLASLDNAAIVLIPNMVLPVSEELGVSEGAVGAVTAAVILIAAVTAVGWGFWGDRSNRKRLLLYGTAVWACGAALSATATSYWMLFLWQAVTSVGLGSIASVGFSMISDFVRPARRALAMSFWGLSQGLGGIAGGLLASQLGAGDFRRPLIIIAILGAGFGMLYSVAFDPPRGYREPELQALHERDIDYGHRIELSQLPEMWGRQSNRWLVLQGLLAQLAYGSLIWLPLLYQEKVIAEGYGMVTATKVGGMFAALWQVGGVFSILAGHLGDRWQRRDPGGRAKLSTIGILGAIPFFLCFLFLPLRGLEVTPGGSTATLLGEVLIGLVTNPWVGLSFLLLITAAALTGADSPNWLALLSDVNPPEHRGTVYGLGNLANGMGRSAGNGLTGVVAGAIEMAIPPPLNWAVGLAVFQTFFLPTGYCYWRASRSSPQDIRAVRSVLQSRAGTPITEVDRQPPASLRNERGEGDYPSESRRRQGSGDETS
jgi:MFS family permease